MTNAESTRAADYAQSLIEWGFEDPQVTAYLTYAFVAQDDDGLLGIWEATRGDEQDPVLLVKQQELPNTILGREMWARLTQGLGQRVIDWEGWNNG